LVPLTVGVCINTPILKYSVIVSFKEQQTYCGTLKAEQKLRASENKLVRGNLNCEGGVKKWLKWVAK
jgi:hypothetical protein